MQPNRRRRRHCSSMAGLLSRPGTAWHRCLRDCSGEFIRACLAGEASVHLPARVVPLLLRGIPVIVVRFGRHGAFYLWQVWWSAQAGRKGRHELCSSQPYKPPTNHPARPLMQNFFRCAGQIATPCGARYPSWGEARRKSRGSVGGTVLRRDTSTLSLAGRRVPSGSTLPPFHAENRI